MTITEKELAHQLYEAVSKSAHDFEFVARAALAALEPFIKEREAVAYDRALADVGRYLPGIIKDPANAPAPRNPYRENGDDRG